MISTFKDILLALGVPGKVIAGVLGVSLIVTTTLVVNNIVTSHETALQSAVQYIPRSAQKDSLILAKVIDIENATKAHFDSIEKHIKRVQVSIRAGNDINKQKFEMLIQNNTALKRSFDGLDNSLNWFMQSIGNTEKKKLTPHSYLSESITLK